MVGLVAVDGVLGQGAFAPSVSSTHAMDIQVDVQVDEATAWDVLRMTGTFQVLLTVIPGTDTEGLPTVDAEITNLEPTDIAAVAVVLRMDILRLIVAERHLVDAEEG